MERASSSTRIDEPFDVVSWPAADPVHPASDGTHPVRSGLWRKGTPRLRLRTITLVQVSLITVAILVAVATTLLVMNLRHHALRQAEHEQQSLALILADQAERTLEALELVENAMEERLQTATMRTPQDFRERLSGSFVHDELASRARALPQLSVLSIVDADGNLINDSRPLPLLKINFADREVFKAFRTDPALIRFISPPVRNRLSPGWTLYFSHKIVGPNGEFLGMIMEGLRLSYFDELYKVLDTRHGNGIALFRQNGILLTRYPQVENTVGQFFGAGEIFQRLKATGLNSFVVEQTGQMESIDRVIAAQRLVNFPMVVTVTNTVRSLLTDWRRQATSLIAAAVFLELVVAGAGLLMTRQLTNQRLLNNALAARAQADAARQSAEAELVVAHERQQAERALNIQNARFGAALDNMTQALCMFDSGGRLIVANGRVAEMFNLDPADIRPGQTMAEVLGQKLAGSNLQPSEVATICNGIRQLQSVGEPAAVVIDLLDDRTLLMNFRPMEGDGWLVTLEDTSERRHAEARIAHMAQHDALTGLPNRMLFHERLAAAVAGSQKGEPSAVLYLDLDHFKSVNDTLGHPIGDALLREVTARLLQHVRDTDTVARLGGDEFAVVQSSVDQPDGAMVLAERLIEALSQPYHLDGQHVVTGTSIGIAVLPADGNDPDELLRNADLALYSAKSDGRGRYRFFESEMNAVMQARRTLENDLRKALAADEFEVFYQPLMNLKTRLVSGFEALVRWNHPERGLVSPAEFIPLAEETGLIIPLGKWVLRRACAEATTWPGTPKVAVNVSVIQFGCHTLVEDVAEALAESGLDPTRLELEITESVMLDDTDAILIILHKLRDLGVGIAMDDFGTGYSSLSYLRRFPFSKVKIDRSFVQGLGMRGDSDAIVTAVTNLCASLGITTLAEGVETEDQLRQLRAGSCSEAQGYLFSRPRPAADIALLCRTLNEQELAGAAAAG